MGDNPDSSSFNSSTSSKGPGDRSNSEELAASKVPTYVFNFCNLYIPEGEVYQNDEFGILIKPLELAEEFEEKRRNQESKFRSGYWPTAECYIEANEGRAKELAEWLSFIYSFAQNRDVTWGTYYQADESSESARGGMSYTFSIDNTGLQLIKIPHPESSLYSIDGFVDIALTTLDTASANERSRILRDLCLFLEAETDTFWAVKFLLHWIILESNANYNYDDYLQGPGEEIIGKDERNEVRKVAVEHFRETWDEDQVEHLKYVLDQDHIYEASSKTKIKIYLEYLDIDFDTQEMMDIIELARNARNPLLHRNTDERLINNKDVVTDIRKVSFYILLDRLGVDKEFRKRIYTPKIFGPDIK